MLFVIFLENGPNELNIAKASGSDRKRVWRVKTFFLEGRGPNTMMTSCAKNRNISRALKGPVACRFLVWLNS